MDTRFWGPAGWKLLHHAAAVYTPAKRSAYTKFLESIPYILPCKFCRASLTEYYEKLPLRITSQSALFTWLYKIHNCVNDKLRSQGLHSDPNPTLQSVKDTYQNWIHTTDPKDRITVFWDFLFAVAYNHPKEASRSSEPMKDCPPEAMTCKSPCIRNKWNTLPANERQKWYEQFWNSLPAVLGIDISEAYDFIRTGSRGKVSGASRLSIGKADTERTTHKNTQCRRSTVAWLWRLRCALDTSFKDPYTAVCSRIASFSSGCGKGKPKAKTCRIPRRRGMPRSLDAKRPGTRRIPRRRGMPRSLDAKRPETRRSTRKKH